MCYFWFKYYFFSVFVYWFFLNGYDLLTGYTCTCVPGYTPSGRTIRLGLCSTKTENVLCTFCFCCAVVNINSNHYYYCNHDRKIYIWIEHRNCKILYYEHWSNQYVFISVQYLPMALYHVSHKYVDHPSSCTIRQTLCFLVFCDYLVTVRLWMQGCIDNLKQQLPSIQTFQVDDKNIFEFNSIQFI